MSRGIRFIFLMTKLLNIFGIDASSAPEQEGLRDLSGRAAVRAAHLFGLDAMMASAVILCITYAVIIWDKLALLGASVMVVIGALDQNEALKGIDWNTIGMLTGMMILGHVRISGDMVGAKGQGQSRRHPADAPTHHRRRVIPLIKSLAPAYGGTDKIEPLWWCRLRSSDFHQRVKVYVACRAVFLSCLDRTPPQKLIFGKSDDPLH
jgi:hypothetical protein